MSEVKRLVCLANSWKPDGRCVAGLELVEGRKVGWIRPISARAKDAVSERERQYSNGQEPAVLDIIDIRLLEPRPKDHQQENWLLDPDTRWRKVATLPWDFLGEYVDEVTPLWSSNHSTNNGINDAVPLLEARSQGHSLRLIKLDVLNIEVRLIGGGQFETKRRVYGTFKFAGALYSLSITDPIYRSYFLGKADGHYRLRNCFLTISLGEEFMGSCYKLIAAVMQQDGRPTE